MGRPERVRLRDEAESTRCEMDGNGALLGSRDIDGKADRLRKRERMNQARRVVSWEENIISHGYR
jgi:hypothetical protein